MSFVQASASFARAPQKPTKLLLLVYYKNDNFCRRLHRPREEWPLKVRCRHHQTIHRASTYIRTWEVWQSAVHPPVPKTLLISSIVSIVPTTGWLPSVSSITFMHDKKGHLQWSHNASCLAFLFPQGLLFRAPFHFPRLIRSGSRAPRSLRNCY
jgi:hypothetical protein